MATVAKIVDACCDDRTPGYLHGVDPVQVGEGKRWWWHDQTGIVPIGQTESLRTRGKPVTLTRICNRFEPLFAKALEGTSIDAAMLAAVVATESGGDPNAERQEPKLKDRSIGLTQTLTATALGLAKRAGVLVPAKSLPKGGELLHWRAALRDPATSLRLAAVYLDAADQRWKCQGDPVLLYACFNAGGPYASHDNSWGLRAYGTALDAFARWYGDACEVLR